MFYKRNKNPSNLIFTNFHYNIKNLKFLGDLDSHDGPLLTIITTTMMTTVTTSMMT